jgi:hypothetical protein
MNLNAAVDDAELEPELRTPSPRTLRPTFRTRFTRWLFFTMSVLVPGGLIAAGYFQQQEFAALLDHGASTTATVADRIKADDKDSLPRLKLAYHVNGADYALFEPRPREVWAESKVGDKEDIVYLPEHPGTSASKKTLSSGNKTSPDTVALYIVAGIIALITLPCWAYVVHCVRRTRRLLTDGVPVSGRLLEVSFYMYGQYRVRYEFELNGETIPGKGYIEAAAVSGLGPVGGRTTIVYDPLNPRRFDLYPVMKKFYTIVPTETRFGFPVTPQTFGATALWLLFAVVGGTIVSELGLGVDRAVAQPGPVNNAAPANEADTIDPATLERLRQTADEMERNARRMQDGTFHPSPFNPSLDITEDPQYYAYEKEREKQLAEEGNKIPWTLIYNSFFLIFCIFMFFRSLAAARRAKAGAQEGAAAKAAVDAGNVLAKQAGERYNGLLQRIESGGLGSERAALQTESATVAELLSQAAKQFRLAATSFDAAAQKNAKNPAVAETLKLDAAAFRKLAESKESLQQVAQLVGKPSITDASAFQAEARPWMTRSHDCGAEFQSLTAQAKQRSAAGDASQKA